MTEEELKFSVSVAKDGKDFVGLNISSTECKVVFPLGFSFNYEIIDIPESSINKDVLDSFHKDTRLMLKTLIDYHKEKEGIVFTTLNGKKTSNSFPIDSVIYLIKRYLVERNYFKENEIQYEKSFSGKINWYRTIKQIKPMVNHNRIVYLDFIVRKNKIDENEIITLIHKYCVSKAFELLGFLFSSIRPQANDIPFYFIEKNRKYFSSILIKKIEATHLEDNKLLFIHLLKLLKNISFLDSVTNFTFGTTSYHVVWEKMIDSLFCNIPDKSIYFPHSKWIYPKGWKGPEIPLEPDTIMLNKNDCFILDSKYYNKDFLPESGSIVKQIAYGQYIDKHFSQFLHIYNVFIIPGNIQNEDLFSYIAYSDSDWVDNRKERGEYSKIIAIIIDTKTIMENHNKSEKIISIFSDFIIKCYNKYVKS